ncbi:GntR family transcriptional regulator [Klebsiella pneumoniae]|nr:GntR family transcriptional regulator [Klebsiella pneumoniae]
MVNGALSAFALILRLFTGPGDRVVIDAPTYPMAISAIQGASCRPVGVALPQQGWDCDGLAATIAQTAPRLAWADAGFSQPHRTLYGCPHPPAGCGHRPPGREQRW